MSKYYFCLIVKIYLISKDVSQSFSQENIVHGFILKQLHKRMHIQSSVTIAGHFQTVTVEGRGFWSKTELVIISLESTETITSYNSILFNIQRLVLIEIYTFIWRNIVLVVQSKLAAKSSPDNFWIVSVVLPCVWYHVSESSQEELCGNVKVCATLTLLSDLLWLQLSRSGVSTCS